MRQHATFRYQQHPAYVGHARSTSASAPIAPQGRPHGTGKLAACVVFFKELVEQGPDITLFELRDALACAHGVSARHSTIAVLLKRLGFTHKKSWVATERRRSTAKQCRREWIGHRVPVIRAAPERIVFIDTTAVKAKHTPMRGWSAQGGRLVMDAIWKLANSAPDRKLKHRCVDCPLGDQGSNEWGRFGNLYPGSPDIGPHFRYSGCL